MALVLVAAPWSVPTAQAASGPTTLELWRFFNECAAKYPPDVTTIDPNNADVCAVQQILANQFNAANPELQVKTTSLLWPGIVELNSALSAGTPPDIVSLHAFRVLGVIDSQVRALRKRSAIDGFTSGNQKGTYWGIWTNIADYGLPSTLPCPHDLTLRIAATPTRLGKMDDAVQERLINWGYAVCDAALRKHVDPAIKKGDFPYPGGV